ncbi:UbiH/UbiF/VisC/COQ6 family ubiquinone biosynthesis hydroxylase [Neptuniibacter sp. QD48_55]|uniref:UbiH/UbiF/VisC/COQ6 family ubiquinone biosynthesis hydroxylase n=1 Tax=Neptuniibacter sp. QD48_55 TaxID=3398212 RepID=UPI0039F4706D
MPENTQAQVLNSDVVIVGAGMVGVTLAAALADADIKVTLLEQREGDISGFSEFVKGAQAKGYDPRVSALTCASQQILTSVGAWKYIQDYRLSPYTEMDVWDGEGTGHIHFSARELHEPALGHIVENRVTLAGLYQVLLETPSVELITGVTVTELSPQSDQGRAVKLSDGRIIQADLVVAADGALSKTRQHAGLPMVEWDYGHHAIVTTVKTELPHQATAWQRFTEDGPLALLPLSSEEGDYYCSIVWSTSPEHANELMALPDEEFCQQLGRAFEKRLGEIEWCDQRSVFPLRQRHAQHYIQPGFAAIGDAAHTIHPLAGQGVNLGLLDAAQLAETLMDASRRGEPLGAQSVLRRFQRERRNDNIQMSLAMESFKRLFNTRQPLACLARNMGMNLLDKLSPVKNHIVMDAMGLSGRLPQLAQRNIQE